MQEIETEIVRVDAQRPAEAIIERAARLIRGGELVVFPTETVYGLGADAFQVKALEQIFAAKGRPFSDPLIVHIADESALEMLAAEVSALARVLARIFWPGPLTLILPAAARVPGRITAGLATVAIRMPRHPVALALIRAAGTPIAAPSANQFMHISPTTAQHARADLDGRVPLILDGGPCEVGVESTVLDLCSAVPTLLRPGGIGLEALRAVIPTVQTLAVRSSKAKESGQAEEAQVSPGQMPVHYAPTVTTLLFEGTEAAMREAMLAEVQRHLARGEQVGILVADEDVAAFHGSGALIYTLGSTPEQIATRLFAGLRTLEEAGVHIILCRSFSAEGLGLAVGDRLRKAAGGKVIHHQRFNAFANDGS